MTEEQFKQADLLASEINNFSNFLRELSQSDNIFNLPGLYGFNDEEKKKLCEFSKSKFIFFDLKHDLQEYSKERISKLSVQFNELIKPTDFDRARRLIRDLNELREQLKLWDDEYINICVRLVFANHDTGIFSELKLPLGMDDMKRLSVNRIKEEISKIEKSIEML